MKKYFFILLLLVACGKENPQPLTLPVTYNNKCDLSFKEWCGTLKWNKGPEVGRENEFILYLAPKEGRPTPPSTLKISIHMTCCGSPASFSFNRVDDSRYRISDLQLNTPKKKWELTAEISKDDKASTIISLD